MPQGYYQQPAYPQQPQYAPPPQFPQAPPQGYYQQPVPQAPPTPPPAPVASGTIDEFYSQPSAAGGPGISWKDKPLGTTYAGIISGVCRVQQDTDFDSGRPLFQRDQVTPKWVMLIPLSSVQSNFQTPVPEFPDGEAVFYVRGQARDELVRAMGEAGCSGEPQAGAAFQVTLTQRKPNRKGNPSNIVQIKYVPPGGVAHQAQPAAETGAASPAPEQLPQQAPVQQVQPTQQFQPAQYPQVATQPQQPTVDQTIAQQGPPPQWAGQQQQIQQPVQPSQPQVPVQQTAPQPPPGLDPKQAELLAKLTGGGQPS